VSFNGDADSEEDAGGKHDVRTTLSKRIDGGDDGVDETKGNGGGEEVTDDEDDDNHGADIGQHDLTGSPEAQHTLFFIKCKNKYYL
jgi:hypothetical protein